MKKLFLLILTLVMVLGSAVAYAAEVYSIDGEPRYEGSLATTTSAVGFPAAARYYTDPGGRTSPAKAALIYAETAGVNFTLTGTTPTTYATTDVGMPLNTNFSYVIKGLHAIANFLCINQVASSGAVLKYIILY